MVAARKTVCHPNRKHCAKGFCKACYYRAARAADPEKTRNSARKYYEKNAEKVRAQVRKYSAANPERIRERNKKYCATNPEKVRARKRKYYASNLENARKRARERQRRYCAAHPEKIKERMQRYAAANPDKIRARSARWRAMVKGMTVPGREPSSELLAGLTSPGARCFYCQCAQAVEVDHFIPLKKGGLHVEGNLVGACKSCNSSKGAKLPFVEWLPPSYRADSERLRGP